MKVDVNTIVCHLRLQVWVTLIMSLRWDKNSLHVLCHCYFCNMAIYGLVNY